MSLTTAPARITSDGTAHYATLHAGPYVEPDRWQVSWWPGRLLSPSQAYDAVKFAEIAATPSPDPDADRAALNYLAASIGLDVDKAIPMALRDLADGPTDEVCDSHSVGADPLLTQAEMDRAINDPSDLHHLTIEQARYAMTLLALRVPEETAAAIVETRQGRAA